MPTFSSGQIRETPQAADGGTPSVLYTKTGHEYLPEMRTRMLN